MDVRPSASLKFIFPLFCSYLILNFSNSYKLARFKVFGLSSPMIQVIDVLPLPINILNSLKSTQKYFYFHSRPFRTKVISTKSHNSIQYDRGFLKLWVKISLVQKGAVTKCDIWKWSSRYTLQQSVIHLPSKWKVAIFDQLKKSIFDVFSAVFPQ